MDSVRLGWLVSGVVFVAWLAGCGVAQAPEAEAEDDKQAVADGRPVLVHAIAKRGGVKALTAIRDYEVVMGGMATTPMGATVDVEVRRKVLLGETPCLYSEQTIRTEDSVVREVCVLKGKRGIRRTTFGGGAYSREQVAHQWANLHRSDLFILRAALDPTIGIDDLGAGTVGETATRIVRVRRPRAELIAVDVDPVTGRVLRIRWAERARSGAPPRAFEIRYSDFRSLAGIADLPRQAEVRLDGKVVQKRTTKEWKVNVGLKPDQFEVDLPAKRPGGKGAK